MEKIAVIGFENKSEISARYSGKALVDFDVDCVSRAVNFSYSAVFIKSGVYGGVIRSWLANEHMRIADDTNALFAEIDFFLGIPEPLEIERKFLIEKPDESKLAEYKFCDCISIAQAYINKNGERYRVRKRGADGEFVYIKTEKIKITEMKRIEKESRITETEYLESIKGEKVLYKNRYLLLYGSKCFELDVFPFWPDKALLEIELKSETESFEIPPFLNVIKEVTQDKSYRNSVLSQIYGIRQ